MAVGTVISTACLDHLERSGGDLHRGFHPVLLELDSHRTQGYQRSLWAFGQITGFNTAHRLIAIDHRRGCVLKGKKPRKSGAGNETLKTSPAKRAFRYPFSVSRLTKTSNPKAQADSRARATDRSHGNKEIEASVAFKKIRRVRSGGRP